MEVISLQNNPVLGGDNIDKIKQKIRTLENQFKAGLKLLDLKTIETDEGYTTRNNIILFRGSPILRIFLVDVMENLGGIIIRHDSIPAKDLVLETIIYDGWTNQVNFKNYRLYVDWDFKQKKYVSHAVKKTDVKREVKSKSNTGG